jgi:HSP20 family molecular chaperone IbpA
MDLNKNDSLESIAASLGRAVGRAVGTTPFVVGVSGNTPSEIIDKVTQAFGSLGVNFNLDPEPVAPRHANLRYKVSSRDENFFFSVALAGVHENDVEVDVTESTVSVSAKFYDDGDESGSVPVIRSFTYSLDEDSRYDDYEFSQAGTEAVLKRGLLSLRVPLKQVNVGSKVSIKVG